MRKALLIAASLLLASNRLAAAPCAPSPTTLCLNASRFEVDVSWRDSRGRTGVGQAVPITADTGYFWFFSEANIELVVKVLDARALSGKYWVFFGALTSVEFDLTVTDTVTGAVKNYHNPLGQFASVGDTSAFEGAVDAPPTAQTVEVAGTAAPPGSLDEIQGFIDAVPHESMKAASESAAAFTPCADGRPNLFLTSCRFRLEVHWTDSHGRHGSGQPVQLTNDTGYFWFFSPSNVELMIKVLDARSISGKFWVFFGALSNVAYTINVVDTISGAMRSYSNPASTFASVGDTAAFRGGDGITVETHSPRAASAPIPALEGGSLSATAADGTVFTLDIPATSLLFDEVVTMTPVGAVGHFPFAGGLVAGVDIQPSGTPLLQGATLSIHTAAPLAGSEETPVAWNGSGEDLFLFPPWPTSGDLKLEIFHLGGYGVARGTDSERQSRLEREPVADGDLLSHAISPFLRDGRAAAASIGGPEFKRIEVSVVQRLDAGYQALKIQMEATDGEPARVVDLIHQTNAWVLEVPIAVGAPMETVFPGRTEEIYSLWKRMISLALSKIHERCSEDPHAIFSVFPIIKVARSGGLSQRFPELQSEIDQVFKCLTFKLTFDSSIAETGGPFSESARVVAESVTLRGHSTQNGLEISGEGPILHEHLEACCAPDDCPVLLSSTPSTFKARMYWGGDQNVKLLYDTGTPHDAFSVTCISFSFADFWLKEYGVFHFADRYVWGTLFGGAYPYFQEHWSLTGRKDPWATATVAQTDSQGQLTASEITRFTLTHTPE